MNPISKAVTDVIRRIPKGVLSLAFRQERGPRIISIGESIMVKVIRPTVLVDLNLLSSNTITIPLSKCSIENHEDESIITVPKTLIGGKTIISVESLSNTHTAAGDEERNAANESIIHTNLQLIGENTILVNNAGYGLESLFLVCNIEYSNNMSELPAGAYFEISKLVTMAVKSYIHNTLIEQIDMGYIYQGSELGVVRDLIDKMEDAEELYQEQLELVVAKVLYMSDSESMSGFVTNLFPSTI